MALADLYYDVKNTKYILPEICAGVTFQITKEGAVMIAYRAYQYNREIRDNLESVKRNIEVLSCNHCCSGKAISITYSECVSSVSYPLCNAHAPYFPL